MSHYIILVVIFTLIFILFIVIVSLPIIPELFVSCNVGNTIYFSEESYIPCIPYFLKIFTSTCGFALCSIWKVVRFFCVFLVTWTYFNFDYFWLYIRVFLALKFLHLLIFLLSITFTQDHSFIRHPIFLFPFYYFNTTASCTLTYFFLFFFVLVIVDISSQLELSP